MTENGRENTDETLALALASTGTRREAAMQTGVGERTLYRRLTDPAFRERVDSLRREITKTAAQKLSDAATDAVNSLRDLASSAADDSIRLKAANSILDQLAKFNVPGSDSGNGDDPAAERMVAIAFSFGKYRYVLPPSGTIPPELEAKIPNDPRQRARLMELVRQKIKEIENGECERYSPTNQSEIASQTVPGYS